MSLAEMSDEQLITDYRYFAGLLIDDFIWMKKVVVSPEHINRRSEHRAFMDVEKNLPVFIAYRKELWRRKANETMVSSKPTAAE